MDKKKYWIWLSLAIGAASTVPQKLLNKFGNDIENIYSATENDLKEIKLTQRQIARLSDKSLDEAELIIDWCTSNNVGILCYDDCGFPKRLASLPDSPIVLYYIGELYDIDSLLCLAGVGTRSMTRYGYDIAYTFCHDLARSGAVIVSGMAAGIDSACHRGCLDAGGRTIAVLGCRINKVYPANNRDLMVEIARKGLILTEYHPFYHTKPANFPQRNRIISGLCQGTIVFEADIGSGSLITAQNAQRQGRKVYALPGKIGDANSLGTNDLIKNGAQIVTRASDILDEYSFLYPTQIKNTRVFDYSPAHKAFDTFINSRRKIKTPKTEGAETKKAQIPMESSVSVPAPLDTSGLSEIEASIYNSLEFDTPISPEQLIFPNTSFGEIFSALTMLELKGYINILPGNKYVKNGKLG